MLAAFLGSSALASLLAGGAAWFSQRGQLDARIDESLVRSANELRRIAGSGVNPVTGEPFRSAEDVVVASIQLTVPAQNEGVLGSREGRTPLVSQQDVRSRLEEDAELVAASSPLVAGDHVVSRSVGTATADYRALVAPVRATGADGAGPPAALVLAYDRSAEHAEFAQVFRTYAVVALGALVLIGVVGWVVAGRLSLPIRTLSRTAQRIGETDLSARIPVTGNDDLSDSSRTVNGMLDRLEGAFDSQRRLIDDVGHESRTPLTVVRGHLELMDPHDATDATETRDLALDELDRMNRLVDDLVTLATAGRPDFVRPLDTDLGRSLDDVHDKVRTLGDRRWLVDARADVAVRADAQRLTQALLQLAANAVKFSAPGSAVALGSAVSDDGARVRVWVRDEGVGIAPEQQERIFERFAQATTPGAAHPEGAGSGLAIVAAIADGHGGRVHVASTPGVGSTFTLDSPLVPVPGPAPATADVATPYGATAPTAPTAPSAATPESPPDTPDAPPTSPGAGSETGTRTGTDDGADNGARSSTETGAQTGTDPDGRTTRTTVATGREAFDLASSGDFALLVLDLGSPDQDGFTVSRRSRETGNAIPVIILTARTSVTDTVAGLEGGADDYMAKPFRFEELLARIRLRSRSEPAGEVTVLTHGASSSDSRTRRARTSDREVDLSAREFALAEAFSRNPGQVLSREQLSSRVWGYDFDPGSNVVDVYVRYSRNKLGAEHFVTVRGMGYRLADAPRRS
ncbi:hypothetical protein OY671_005827 [Metschnikowia pulcherrima]|nr:hypothetical protein OY671_005827 [Metschnikowia pulcherrima]